MISIVKDIACVTEMFVPANVNEVILVSQQMLSMLKSLNKVTKYYNYELFKALYSVLMMITRWAIRYDVISLTKTPFKSTKFPF